MSTKTLLYIIAKAPYSNAVGQEAIDAILIGASFEQHISVLFLHDGVFQLKAEQNNKESGLKEFTKTYRALGDFGVEQIFCHDLSLAARGLAASDLMVDVEVLSSERVSTMIASSDRAFTF